MTAFQRQTVLNAVGAARAAGRKAHAAALAAKLHPLSLTHASAAETAALNACRAAKAAEDAAYSLDPEEALENEAVWDTHCMAMGAADFARRAADAASRCT